MDLLVRNKFRPAQRMYDSRLTFWALIPLLLAGYTQERAAALERTLGEYHDQHVGESSSFVGGKGHQWPQHVVKRQRKQINLKVRTLTHCTLGGLCSKQREASLAEEHIPLTPNSLRFCQ